MSKKIFYAISILLISSIVIAGVYLLFIKQDEIQATPDESTNIKETVIEEKEPEITTTSATLLAVGDVLVHRTVYQDAQLTNTTYDFTKMFTSVKPIIETADFAIANSETMIGGVEIGISDYPSFNSPVEVGQALKWSGFDAVTLANNHTIDRGEKAVIAGLNNWDEIGLVKTGAARTFEEQSTIATYETNDITFSLLSYTYGTNGIPVPTGKEYLVNGFDEEKMANDIEKAKKLSDVVIVAMHWGNEYETMPNESQKEWAQWLSDKGVNIILGSHPHVLQPPNWVTGETGNKTYVIYSMGNYISAQKGIERLIGGIFGITIEKTTVDDEVTIALKEPTVVPIYTSYQNFTNFHLYELSKVDSTILSNASEVYTDTKARLQTYLGEELAVD